MTRQEGKIYLIMNPFLIRYFSATLLSVMISRKTTMRRTEALGATVTTAEKENKVKCNDQTAMKQLQPCSCLHRVVVSEENAKDIKIQV